VFSELDFGRMKLSELIQHTSDWTGMPLSHVRTVARVLQPSGLISSAGRNPRGAETTVDDKINLLVGVCGVEVANRAAEHVRAWRRMVRIDEKPEHEWTRKRGRIDADKFTFLKSATVQDFFLDLITKDLNGGPLDAWLTAASGHEITLDFHVDDFGLTIAVSRISSSPIERAYGPRSALVTEVHFMSHGEHEYEKDRHEGRYRAPSRLLRRLSADNIRGWGTCLTDPDVP
jgi:hypothetical protein